MRVLTIILGAALFGGIVGGAVAYVEVRSDPDLLVILDDENAPPVLIEEGQKLPRVEVEQPHFNFGQMERGREKSHRFVVRNVGDAPLTLRVGPTSCKCTLSEVQSGALAPGETTHVKLEWSAKSDNGPFRQTATIHTNDPLQPDVELTIDGEIVNASGVEPPDFIFDKMAVGETKSAQVYVMAMLQDELKVDSAELGTVETRDRFDVKIEPVERDQLPNNKARAGVRITVTAKPGLPLGRFDQFLTLNTNLKEGEKLHIPIIGRVVGDISVHGTNWSEDEQALNLGHVDSQTGKKARLNIVVRGENAAEVKFDVNSADPPALKATFGESKRLKDTLAHVSMEIEIPAGTRPMNRLGTAQGEEARIVLKTTHPTMKELSVPVRFAVGR
jgi:hypothetical protein